MMRWSLFFVPLRNTAAPEPRPRASRPRAPRACAPPEGTSIVSFHTTALGKRGFYFTFIQILLFLPIHPTCPSCLRRTRRKCRRAPTAARDRRESSHRLRLNSTFFTLYDTKLTDVMILNEIYQFDAIKRLNSNFKFELQTARGRGRRRESVWPIRARSRVPLTNQIQQWENTLNRFKTTVINNMKWGDEGMFEIIL